MFTEKLPYFYAEIIILLFKNNFKQGFMQVAGM